MQLTAVAVLLTFSSGAYAKDGVDRVPRDFQTIQQAIDLGDNLIIEVGPGDWAGAVVSRPVALFGNDSVIRRGAKVSRTHVGFELTSAASGSRIDGFEFACGDSLDMGVNARADGLPAASQVTVTDNRFVQCVQGVTVSGEEADFCDTDDVNGGQYWVIEGNTFDGFATRSSAGATGGGIGVMLYNVVAVSVLSNRFVGAVKDQSRFTTTGVGLAGCIDCTVGGNAFEVEGGEHYWSAVTNVGSAMPGAVASVGLLVVDNDARDDSKPQGVNYRSFDSYGSEFDGNSGVVYIDHQYCGDERLELF